VLFKIVDPGSEWTVEGAAVSPADFGTAGTTMTLKDEDLAGLSAGDRLRSLYQHGKLRVDGDVSVAHRLGLLKGLL
jgi:3-hydroxyacyl-CoA dehydrogenase/3a,7a,12a-trihydroxy-5b-cholest-24-enoyl-CoA hydratase